MLSRIEIEGYRAFSKLTVEPLRRLTFVVGPNNAGKTSLLEAIDLLVHSRDARAIESVLRERGEVSASGLAGGAPELEFSGLFHGRDPRADGLRIDGRFRDEVGRFEARIHVEGKAVDTPLRDLDPRRVELHGTGLGEAWRLAASGAVRPPQGLLGALTDGVLALPSASSSHSTRHRDARLVRMGPARLPEAQVFSMWDRVALTEGEDRVLEALRIITPEIEKATVLGSPGQGTGRVFVKLRGNPGRVPLASLGEGLGRLFELALALGTLDSGGILLVDEIDTGLHHRVLESLFRLVARECRRRDLQVVATTHSLDCLRGLAAYATADDSFDDICVHRLDPKASSTTYFDATELRVAVEHEAEIR